jgi:hypothetical protein
MDVHGGPTRLGQFNLQSNWITQPPRTRLPHYIFVWFQGVFGHMCMAWVHEIAHSAGVHTRYTPACTNLVPVLLTYAWHNTL